MKNMKLTSFQKSEAQAANAGFEFYVETFHEDHGKGIIMYCLKMDSPYNGEVLDLFEDGTILHYSQFAGAKLNFKFQQ